MPPRKTATPYMGSGPVGASVVELDRKGQSSNVQHNDKAVDSRVARHETFAELYIVLPQYMERGWENEELQR